MPWECKYMHTWEATTQNVKSGYWCPFCSKRSNKQRDLFEIIKGLYPSFKHFYNFKRFKWLKGQEIDIFVTDNKNFSLGIEYDGI